MVSLQIPDEAQSLEPISSIKFNADGKKMVAVLDGRIHYVDSFSGEKEHTFVTGKTKGGPAMEATFSPDGCYLLSGGGRSDPIGPTSLQGRQSPRCARKRADVLNETFCCLLRCDCRAFLACLKAVKFAVIPCACPRRSGPTGLRH